MILNAAQQRAVWGSNDLVRWGVSIGPPSIPAALSSAPTVLTLCPPLARPRRAPGRRRAAVLPGGGSRRRSSSARVACLHDRPSTLSDNRRLAPQQQSCWCLGGGLQLPRTRNGGTATRLVCTLRPSRDRRDWRVSVTDGFPYHLLTRGQIVRMISFSFTSSTTRYDKCHARYAMSYRRMCEITAI